MIYHEHINPGYNPSGASIQCFWKSHNPTVLFEILSSTKYFPLLQAYISCQNNFTFLYEHVFCHPEMHVLNEVPTST